MREHIRDATLAYIEAENALESKYWPTVTALTLSLANGEKWSDLRMEFWQTYQDLLMEQGLDEEIIHHKRASHSRMLRMAYRIARQGTATVKACVEQKRGFYSAYQEAQAVAAATAAEPNGDNGAEDLPQQPPKRKTKPTGPGKFAGKIIDALLAHPEAILTVLEALSSQSYFPAGVLPLIRKHLIRKMRQAA